MPFKFNISDKGKTWKIEAEAPGLFEKSIGVKVNGAEISSNLDGYEFEMTGGSDISGFPMYKEVEGIGLKRVLLTKGWGMKDNRKGIRLRKTIRGKTISEKIVQINLKLIKQGNKPLAEIFPEQNKIQESEKPAEVKEANKEVKTEAPKIEAPAAA